MKGYTEPKQSSKQHPVVVKSMYERKDESLREDESIRGSTELISGKYAKKLHFTFHFNVCILIFHFTFRQALLYLFEDEAG